MLLISTGLPRRVVTDYFWAMIQSVLNAFNIEETKACISFEHGNSFMINFQLEKSRASLPHTSVLLTC